MNNTIKGWIIDTPNALVKTSKGNLVIDKSTTGEVSFSGENLEIYAGQGLLALAQIPKSTKVNVKITNAEWSMDSMEMTSGGTATIGAKEYAKYGDLYAVTATNTIVINEAVVPSSVQINGYTETTGTVATKQFKVTVAAQVTTIQFFTDVAAGTIISPSYKVLTAATVVGLTVKSTDSAGSAEVVLTWPIYQSEDVNSGIWANGQLTLYKAKITQNGKLGGSYKSASSFDIEFSALDPRRPDKAIWGFVVNPIA